MFTYVAPTIITEVHHLITPVQLLLTTSSQLTPYTALANFFGLVFTMHIITKAMPINDND